MQTQFQLCSYIHAYTNETHSLANLQDLTPTFPAIYIKKHKPAKVGIKSCRECVSLDITTQLELCSHEQTQIIASAAC